MSITYTIYHCQSRDNIDQHTTHHCHGRDKINECNLNEFNSFISKKADEIASFVIH